MRVFKELYETDVLSTIRFTDRRVKVKSEAKSINGDVIEERVIKVPIYYDDDGEEILVSDLASRDFVYSELFIHNVGKGF